LRILDLKRLALGNPTQPHILLLLVVAAAAIELAAGAAQAAYYRVRLL